MSNHLVDKMYEYGFKGRPSSKGQWYVNCPVCNKNFSVNIKTGAYICFSAACGIRGNIRKFIGNYEQDENYDLKNDNDVAKIIGELFGTQEVVEQSEPLFTPPNENELINYQFIHPYITERGFDDDFLIKNKIGYKASTHSITIPIFFNEYYYGCIERTVVPDQTPKYRYPENLPKKLIFYRPLFKAPSTPKSGQKFSETLIIVEGSLDALKLAQNGFNAISILGSSLSEEQAELIRNYIDVGYQIILCLDNDKAGKDGTMNAISDYQFLDWRVVDWNRFNAELTDQLIDKTSGVCDNESVGKIAKDPGDLTGEEMEILFSTTLDKLEWIMNC